MATPLWYNVPMAMIQASGIKFGYGSTTVIEDATFHIDDGDKVGIVGPNGAGKTTLLKLITNLIQPDSGAMNIRRGTEIGYLEQNIEAADKTIFEYCEEIFQDISEMESRLRALEKRMGEDAGDDVMTEYSELLERFEDREGYATRSKVNSVLNGLKMDGAQKLSLLSGGERSKVAMARLLLRNPELLILDEPTNHLDIESISWMEGFLKDYKGTILVVSHDRYFLDKICTKILHFEFGRASMYRGGYRKVMNQIMEQKTAQLKAYELQQKEISRQEGIIREFYSRATEKQIKKAKSRQRLLDKVERIEKPGEDRTSFHLNLESSGRGGNDVLILTDITKQFGDRKVLDHASLYVAKDDKIGLIGANGTGKTTLFRIALGELVPDEGMVKFGSEITTGYFSQNMEQLDWNKSILEEVHDAYPRLDISEIRGKLGAFLFKDNLDRKIGSVSGGERSRIQLLKLMMSPANLLLLDEPTNHLDTYSKEILDRAISNYSGSAVIISHDRFFLNEVCNKIAVLKDGKIEVFEGNYDDYLYTDSLRKQEAEKREQAEKEEALQREKKRVKKNKNDEKKTGEKKKPGKKALEREIEVTEERIAVLEQRRYEEEVYSDFRKSKEVEEELEELKKRCEELYEQLLS